MRLTKKRSCRECQNMLLCKFYQSIKDVEQEAVKMGIFAVYESEAPLLSYQIYNAVAATCKEFTERIYPED